VTRFLFRTFALLAILAGLAAGAGVAVAAASSSPAGVRAAAASKKPAKKSKSGKKKAKAHNKKPSKGKKPQEEKLPAGPSVSVIGFGVNRLWVPHGKTVKSNAECSEMVVGNGGPIGPPQNVFITVYVQAGHIPSNAPLKFKDELTADYEGNEPELSESIEWGKLFTAGPGFAGAPPEKKVGLFHFTAVSYLAEFGTGEGPSAEELDGKYSFTAQVEAGGGPITSTATVDIECPMLR
jgi:hypothetical protein